MGTKRKILIADDARDFVAIVRRFLDSQGFETYAAFEGIRAIEMAVKKLPDLILLDIQMPVGDGVRVLEALRSRPATKEIPIIVLTATAEQGLEEQMHQRGAQGLLFKPIDDDILLTRIKTLLSEC